MGVRVFLFEVDRHRPDRVYFALAGLEYLLGRLLATLLKLTKVEAQITFYRRLGVGIKILIVDLIFLVRLASQRDQRLHALELN